MDADHGEMLDKTLYLTEKHGVEVRRDGPSVWVRERGRSGYRIPAREIGRVVVLGNVRMESGVISLFTEERIPVAFMSRQGRELAVCVPYNHQLPGHHEEQRLLCASDRYGLLFTQWLRSARRASQLVALRELSSEWAAVYERVGFRERDYEMVVKSLRPEDERQWRAARKVVEGLLHEMIIRSLLRADLDPHISVLKERHNFALALELSQALAGEVDLQTLQFLEAARTRGSSWRSPDGAIILKDGLKALIEGFERRKKRIHDSIEGLIDGLFGLIREVRAGAHEQEERQ
jgi:CRISPR/Cas system-associated endonuclease Cas1